VNAADIVPDTEIIGLSADSREVRPGFLFAAIPGAREDGRRYIDQAIAKGAVAVLAPPSVLAAQIGGRAHLVTDPNPRRRLALMAARFHGAQPDTIAAVTGTNGKTSVASFARQLWTLHGERAAAIGTLGIAAPGWNRGPGLTTPDPVHLHETLAALKRDGIDRLALEASSHGLGQHRLDGVRIVAAAFTNLSRDHLDYHPSMAAYRDAKLRLFDELLIEGGVAVCDAESPLHEAIAEIAKRRNLKLVTFGRARGDIRCLAAAPRDGAWSLSLDACGARFEFDFPLPGEFQISNALCALALVIGCGAAPRAVAPLLSRLDGVPGRMQLAGRLATGASVIVDYAHTPDALATVLRAARTHVTGRLVVVFGCGGDRDPGKRPEMGVAAARFADRVIVTDDNPRGEDPAAIRAQARAACPMAEEIGDRGAAIAAAIGALEAGDVLVIAGKGHEQGQIVAGRTLPFDDLGVARAAIAGRDGASA
jgi:UDP-N-acetylmuramoyl-L-alanyl-D-glutamate--2,6-diaminopimelate ligase